MIQTEVCTQSQRPTLTQIRLKTLQLLVDLLLTELVSNLDSLDSILVAILFREDHELVDDSHGFCTMVSPNDGFVLSEMSGFNMWSRTTTSRSATHSRAVIQKFKSSKCVLPNQEVFLCLYLSTINLGLGRIPMGNFPNSQHQTTNVGITIERKLSGISCASTQYSHEGESVPKHSLHRV